MEAEFSAIMAHSVHLPTMQTENLTMAQTLTVDDNQVSRACHVLNQGDVVDVRGQGMQAEEAGHCSDATTP